jgi:hypothetical protein
MAYLTFSISKSTEKRRCSRRETLNIEKWAWWATITTTTIITITTIITTIQSNSGAITTILSKFIASRKGQHSDLKRVLMNKAMPDITRMSMLSGQKIQVSRSVLSRVAVSGINIVMHMQAIRHYLTYNRGRNSTVWVTIARTGYLLYMTLAIGSMV